MARILAIDYGKKRTGIAVTDPLKIIANGLTTVASHELIVFLKKYFSENDVELIVIGMPKNLDLTNTDATILTEKAIERIKKAFPEMPIETLDERFTSKMAKAAMIDMGMRKADRNKKENIDEIAATIILQNYLQQL